MQKLISKYKDLTDKEIVLLQSGGMDSVICAALFNKCGFKIHHVFVDYGQNAKEQEVKQAKKTVDKYGGEFYETSVSLPWLNEATTLVGNFDTDDGSLNNEPLSAVVGGAYVPFRNALLLSIAVSLAEAKRVRYIGVAFDGSENIFHRPTGGTVDKHPAFVKAYENLLAKGTSMSYVYNTKIKVLTPVMDMNKYEIVKLGLDLDVDVSDSWSCYNNTETPCGVCSPCATRREVFEYFGIQGK